MFTGAVFFKAVERGDLFAYSLTDQCMALSMHLYTRRDAGDRTCRVAALRHRGGAARLGAAGQRDARSCCGSTCARGRSGERRELPRRKPIEVAATCASPTARKEVHPRHFVRRAPQRDLRHHRAGAVGQDVAAALPQPHARLHAERARSRHDPGRRRGRAAHAGRLRAAAQDRDGGAAAGGSAAQIYDNVAFAPRCAGLREHGRARRARRALPAPGRAVGRGEGPARRASAPSSPAASSSGSRSRARSRTSPRSCASTSSRSPSTRSRRCASRTCSRSCSASITIILVTNLVQQARRLADRTMFLWNGEIVELGPHRGDLLATSRASRQTLRVRARDLRMSARGEPRASTRATLNLWYGNFQALKDVSISTSSTGIITSLIGPSGCGKTTLLRCFNRINERYGYVRTDGRDRGSSARTSTTPDVSLVELRKAVGMVFQRPNPLPLSVYENVVFGLRAAHARRGRSEGGARRGGREGARREVGLWNDLKDRLRRRATDAAARAAAEAVHRAAAAAEARGHPDGRAVLGARRRGHARHRGADVRACAGATRS